MPARWLIYALGTGLGHLTRAMALARAAGKFGHSVCILTNSPYANTIAWQNELKPSHTCQVFPAEWNREQIARAVQAVLQQIEDFSVLLVDTFPRGLGGELAAWLPKVPIPKILIHRDLNPRYVEKFALRSFAQVYDHILLPGEAAPFQDLPQATMTAPWLIRDAEELLPPEEARCRLQAADDSRPLVIVLGCGKREEISDRAALAARLQSELPHRAVRFLCPTTCRQAGVTCLSIWPCLEIMLGVDVMVGAGGYNTVQEARATGTPLLALPQHRLYDRQAHRLRPCELISHESALIERLQTQLPARIGRASYVNGVHAAVRIIEAQQR